MTGITEECELGGGHRSRNSWYMVNVIACLLIVVRHSSENPLQYALPVG